MRTPQQLADLALQAAHDLCDAQRALDAAAPHRGHDVASLQAALDHANDMLDIAVDHFRQRNALIWTPRPAEPRQLGVA